MRRHLALFTALALASADTEGELRLSLTYNDMADDDDGTTLSNFDEPLSRVQVYHAGEWLDVCDSDGRESVSDWNMNAANVACAQMGLGHADSIPCRADGDEDLNLGGAGEGREWETRVGGAVGFSKWGREGGRDA